jgi:hypothetical protein
MIQFDASLIFAGITLLVAVAGGAAGFFLRSTPAKAKPPEDFESIDEIIQPARKVIELKFDRVTEASADALTDPAARERVGELVRADFEKEFGED